jgi:hypothetical protein
MKKLLLLIVMLLALFCASAFDGHGSAQANNGKRVKIGKRFYKLSQTRADKYGRIPALHVTHGDRGRGVGVKFRNPINAIRIFSTGVGSATGYPPTCWDSNYLYQAILAVPNGSPQVKLATDFMKDMTWTNYIYSKMTMGGKLKFTCDRGWPSVYTVTLPHVASYYTGALAFSNITQDLTTMGYNNAFRHYIVWFDGNAQNGLCGQGQIAGDSSKSINNQNNLGPTYAVVFNPDMFASCVAPPQPSPLPSQSAANGEVILHEIGHTLGAVQQDAPHATNGWHCTDDWDIMCYDDADTVHNPFVRCPTWTGTDANGGSQQLEWFDCRAPGGQQGYGDDYNGWNCPAPPNYLATHWNIANSYQNNNGTVVNGINRYTTSLNLQPAC